MKFISSFKYKAIEVTPDKIQTASTVIFQGLNLKEIISKDAKVILTPAIIDDRIKGYYIQAKGKAYKSDKDITDEDLLKDSGLKITINKGLSNARLPMVRKVTYEPAKGIYAIV